MRHISCSTCFMPASSGTLTRTCFLTYDVLQYSSALTIFAHCQCPLVDFSGIQPSTPSRFNLVPLMPFDPSAGKERGQRHDAARDVLRALVQLVKTFAAFADAVQGVNC